ncbi:MAG: glycosyltransferase [Candidatus Omnitrophica bacterium]|nr:glycosyltransferase [Candidatus Omnitrophota bacterium]
MVYLIIPAYNEERNIAQLVRNTREAMSLIGLSYRIYIVNDGSTDGTSRLIAELAHEAPVTEIKFDANRGVDQAFKAGFEEVFNEARPGDIIVTKEADNTSDHAILKKMIEHVLAGYDVAFASCFAPEGRVENSSLDRHILSFGANALLKIFFPVKGINTYSSFYRAYDAMRIKAALKAYEGRMFEEKGFVCMVEMIVKLSRLPLKMVEVPMVLRCNKREGMSKLRRRRTILGYLKFIKKQALRTRAYDRQVRERFERFTTASR